MRFSRRDFIAGTVAASAVGLSLNSVSASASSTADNYIDIMLPPYSAPGDGSIDETEIFHNAIAALNSLHGGVILARGYHRVNLKILQDNITIIGVRTKQGNPYYGTAPMLQAYDTTQPVIKWGDGMTNAVIGGGLRDISLHGRQLDAKGLYINGLREGYFNNIVIHGFTEFGLHISSNIYPTTHNHFHNLTVSNGNVAGAVGLYAEYSTGTSYNTAIYITGGRISGSVNGSYAVELNGVHLGMTDLYADVFGDRGFKFSTGSSIMANGVRIDSGDPNDILVEVPTHNPITDYIYGMASIDGQVKFDDGSTVKIANLSGIPLGEKFKTMLNSPLLMGTIFINNSNDPESAYVADNNSSFSRSGSSLWWNAPTTHRFKTNGTERFQITESSIRAENPLQFKSYTIATLPGPASASVVRSIVWIENGVDSGHAYSDGATWRWLSSRAPV